MITVKAADLHRLLIEGLICTGNDDTLPMLNGVKLETTDDGQLLAIGTDRFRLGISRIPHGGTDKVDDLLDGKQAKALAAILKPVRARNAPDYTVDLEFVGGRGTYARKMKWARSDGMSGVVDILDHQFPKWRHLVDSAKGVRPIETGDTQHDAYRFYCNAKYLAEFAKAQRSAYDNVAVEPVAGHNRPIIFRVGAHFLGLLMPVRMVEDSSLAAYHDWDQVIAS